MAEKLENRQAVERAVAAYEADCAAYVAAGRWDGPALDRLRAEARRLVPACTAANGVPISGGVAGALKARIFAASDRLDDVG